MLIGVTGRRFSTQATHPHDGAALGELTVDTFFTAYAGHLRSAGAAAVFLPREAPIEVLLGRLDGIVLAGGQDIHPDRYGGPVSPLATEHDPGQDDFDLRLARMAIEAGVPVLGTCRGHEVLNVALGGSLADVDEAVHSVRSVPASRRTQRVDLVGGSVLAGLLGPSVEVNSLHHQAVDRLGEGVRVTARAAEDGAVEGIEVADRAVLGVQWHPEFLDGPDPVLGWLVEQARTRRNCA